MLCICESSPSVRRSARCGRPRALPSHSKTTFQSRVFLSSRRRLAFLCSFLQAVYFIFLHIFYISLYYLIFLNLLVIISLFHFSFSFCLYVSSFVFLSFLCLFSLLNFHYSFFLHCEAMPAPRASFAAGLSASVIGARQRIRCQQQEGGGGRPAQRGLPLLGAYFRPICGPGKRFRLSSVSYHCRPLKSLYRGRQPFQAWRALTTALCG